VVQAQRYCGLRLQEILFSVSCSSLELAHFRPPLVPSASSVLDPFVFSRTSRGTSTLEASRQVYGAMETTTISEGYPPLGFLAPLWITPLPGAGIPVEGIPWNPDRSRDSRDPFRARNIRGRIARNAVTIR